MKDNDKIEEELTIDELLPELRKVIDGYEEAGKKMAWNAVLTIPFLGELVEAVGDAQETYDTFVENLEPELKASLLLLQLLNSKLEVDKDTGKEGVTIPQGSVEALNDLMKQTLSGATKKHLEQMAGHISALGDLHTSLEKALKDEAARTARSVQQVNKAGAEAVNELQSKVDAVAKGAKRSLSEVSPLKGEERPPVASAAGGRKKRTRKAKRRTRRPLAKSKVIKRSTRRRGKHSKRA